MNNLKKIFIEWISWFCYSFNILFYRIIIHTCYVDYYWQYKNMKKNEYKCSRCGKIYEKTWSDEEALSESRELFGELPEDCLEVVCDYCFKARF